MKQSKLHKDNKLNKGSEVCSLVLYNDKINTFNYVIKSLVEVCGHDFIQAEQCALLVHLRGSYIIKSGSREILTAMSRSLNSKGLNTRVEIFETE